MDTGSGKRRFVVFWRSLNKKAPIRLRPLKKSLPELNTHPFFDLSKKGCVFSCIIKGLHKSEGLDVRPTIINELQPI
jgi:hypothetical protein